MGADNSPRPESELEDYLLKKQVVELLEIIAQLGEGEIRSISCQFGLPVAVEIQRQATFDEGDRDA